MQHVRKQMHMGMQSLKHLLLLSMIEFFYANRFAVHSPAFQGADLKPTYFFYVGQHPFHGLLHEKPLDPIQTLEDFVYGIQQHEGTEDYILCKLFKYSLSRITINWLKLLPPGSLSTWNDVKTVFLTEFLDDARIEEIMNKIQTFSQGPTEFFRSSWERFRRYQRDYPHPGFTDVHLLKIFFRGIHLHYILMLMAQVKET